jgi:predicted O-methyltransferase YrrM
MSIGGRLKDFVHGTSTRPASGVPQAFPPGAFYSPVVNATEVLSEPEASRIWPAEVSDPPGIAVRGAEQLALLHVLAKYPFAPDPAAAGPRYDPANDQFPPHDAALLYAMVRHLAPRRMVEVGCGWSTTVTAAAIRDGATGTELTCIEPYPRDFLHEMADVLTLRQEKVEHTPPEVFAQLEAGDVLFIDSSHVAKTGSDVVHQLLNVVPSLSDGVVVHVHDIFIPEDYPQGWVRNGFGWTEQYLLQAFLIRNERAHVLAMNRWLALRHPEAVTAALGQMELHGSSIWFVTGPEPSR